MLNICLIIFLFVITLCSNYNKTTIENINVDIKVPRKKTVISKKEKIAVFFLRYKIVHRNNSNYQWGWKKLLKERFRYIF